MDPHIGLNKIVGYTLRLLIHLAKFGKSRNNPLFCSSAKPEYGHLGLEWICEATDVLVISRSGEKSLRTADLETVCR